jgi:2-polyprenyl-3-methyl-5-hydroxy-6-metoxy-1,4-benzoquinol methylase
MIFNVDTACLLCEGQNPVSFFNEDGLDLLKCTDCGLVFAWPISDRHLLKQRRLWEDNYSNLGNEKEQLDTYGHRLPIFEAFFRKKEIKNKRGSVLDVGCADGLFLTVARGAGWKAFGVEPSPVVSEFARRHHGLDVVTGDLFCENLVHHSYDLITFWDVFEHLQNPQEVLSRAGELLAPHGTLFLRVPNLNYFILKYWILVRLLGHKRCFIPRLHYYYFNFDSLALAFTKAGFTNFHFQVGAPEIYGKTLRRIIQRLFYGIALVAGPKSMFCFSLEAFVRSI